MGGVFIDVTVRIAARNPWGPLSSSHATRLATAQDLGALGISKTAEAAGCARPAGQQR